MNWLGKIQNLISILLVFLFLTAGCAFSNLRQTSDVLSNSTILVGIVSNACNSSKGPVIVTAYSKAGGVRTVTHYAALHEPGPYELIVPGGEYYLFAFEDKNSNLIYDEGEQAGQYQRSETISVTAGGVVSDLDITLSEENTSDIDFPVGTEVAPERPDPLNFTSPGIVVDLDEPLFSPDMGVKAYWEPLEFYKEFGGNICFLDEYDPEKIPLLFVHGAGGTPREWRMIAENIDHNQFQPWFYYYPSGASIEAMSHLLLWKILNLQRKYQFSTMYITAHSMGGLVVRSFLVNFAQNLPLQIKFISISTPWGGDDLANIGVKYSPAVIPSWKEIRSDGRFIDSLFEKKLPENVEHYLFFSFRGNGNPFRPSNDKVVTLQSELDVRAQAEAKMVFGINEDHDSILSCNQMASQLNAILNQRTEDSGSMLQIRFSYEYPSELPKPQPLLFLRSVDNDRVITINLGQDSNGAAVGPIPPGTYQASLLAHAFAPEPLQTTVTIGGPASPEVSFTLKPRGCLIGSIVKPPTENNQAGLIMRPDENIKVNSVSLSGAGIKRTVVSIDGKFDFFDCYLNEIDFFYNGLFYFFNLPKGDYELSIDAQGYRNYSTRRKVVPGQNYNLMTIELQSIHTNKIPDKR